MRYDGIILGTGHNSLILQAYAGRAGLKTLAVDRSEELGGGLSTVEHPAGSGFRHNIHSFYHRGLTLLPWSRDLELARHGANYLQPELNVTMLCRDGRALQWWSDFDKTVTSVANFNARDAAVLQKWRDAFRPIVRSILIPESQSPPLPPADRQRRLEQSADGRLLLETSRLSPLEFVQREFEDPAVQAGMLFFNGLREVDLRQRGFGHHIPALLASDAMAQMCIGGSKQLALALAESIRESGGEMRLGTSLRRIVVENGRAAAIETDAGERIEAKRFIASGLNPQQTFLDLIGPDQLPAEWVEKARNFQYNLLAPLFGLNLNLREMPRYTDADANEALMVILGLDHADQFSEIVAHHQSGTIPPTVMWGTCPTRFDSTQAPAGRHTAFMWEKLPYRLNGRAETWDAVKERHGAEMLELWARFAPNLTDAVIESFTRSPLDTERMLPNMRGGDLLVGAFAGGQVGYHRPFPGAGYYRGHLPGLYLCGSCCHPGGNITGLPGYNCVRVLLADLGVAAPWILEHEGEQS
jgi:phytoene dehydrogenase-like protein